MGEISEGDRKIVKRQLGKDPRGLLDIPVRCRFGYPVVLTTKPVIRDKEGFEIFPTLFWLSCPKRVEEVARIESDGYVRKLEEEIASNPSLKEEYRRDEERYLETQRSLLSEEDLKFLEERGLEDALSRGIGGIKSDEHLKCLHLHIAHQLAGENVLGELIQERFDLGDCSDDRIRCEKFIQEESEEQLERSS
ncbi:MAG: DUF501 domain-containing protein [Candidatus Bipolaricaulota bacterium]|nr:DUF501 domain-containing protein [Candidatus Bipolaricaulota bacterium]MBS3791859.1 DUF501 domain-containing protein [Candidatus Bipolaricaulota bacterium]